MATNFCWCYPQKLIHWTPTASLVLFARGRKQCPTIHARLPTWTASDGPVGRANVGLCRA